MFFLKSEGRADSSFKTIEMYKMSQNKKLAANDIAEKFTKDKVKLDAGHKALLVIIKGAIKEAVSPYEPKGIKFIRDIVKEMGVSPRIDEIKTVLAPEVEGKAWDYDDPKIIPAMRYAKSDDDKAVILDLYNDKNQVVEIKAGSVQVLDSPPASNDNVFFTRPDYMKPMVHSSSCLVT